MNGAVVETLRAHVEHWWGSCDVESGRGMPGGTQRLVSYLVITTPSGNVRVSTRLRFTQLSRAVKNGVPPPPGPDG